MKSRTDVERLAKLYEGVAVLGAVPGSPASVAGSRYGDVILEVNGQRVRSLDEYFEASSGADGSLAMRVMRDGQEVQLALELGKRVDSRKALEYAVESRAFRPQSSQSGDVDLD